MKIGTAEANSTFLSQGQVLAALLEANGIPGPIEVLLTPSASIENAQRIARGEIDYGYMAANWIGRALRGEKPFTAPIPLRLVAPMNCGPMFFIARKGSRIRGIRDLRGKRVSVGMITSGVCQHAHSIFGALGMSFEDFTVSYHDFANGAEALAKGEIDAQLQCPIPNKVMTALDTSTDVEVIDYAAGELDVVLAKNSVYRTAVMKAGSLRALTQDSPQPGVVNVLVTGAAQDAAEVAKVTQIIVKGSDELVRRNALYTGMADLWAPLKTQGEAALTYEGVPLHDGARDAFRALGFLA